MAILVGAKAGGIRLARFYRKRGILSLPNTPPRKLRLMITVMLFLLPLALSTPSVFLNLPTLEDLRYVFSKNLNLVPPRGLMDGDHTRLRVFLCSL